MWDWLVWGMLTNKTVMCTRTHCHRGCSCPGVKMNACSQLLMMRSTFDLFYFMVTAAVVHFKLLWVLLVEFTCSHCFHLALKPLANLTSDLSAAPSPPSPLLARLLLRLFSPRQILPLPLLHSALSSDSQEGVFSGGQRWSLKPEEARIGQECDKQIITKFESWEQRAIQNFEM